MPTLPDVLAPLEILRNARKGALAYYAPLLESDSEVLRVGAWCAVLDRDDITPDLNARAIELCTYPGIRRRAYKHFTTFFEYAFAEAAAAVVPTPEEEAEQAVMQAALAGDEPAQIAALRAHFVATGRIDLLFDAVRLQETIGGWRPALPMAVDLLMLTPHDGMAALELLNLVYNSRQPEMVDAVVDLLGQANLHPYPALLYLGASRLMKGNPNGCLKEMSRLSTVRVPRADVASRLRNVAMQFTGEALEKLGDYKKAYAAYEQMNAQDQQGKPVGLDEFGRMELEAAALDVPQLPTDTHTNYFTMTGFPRSGTTLLENALAAHPRIETFEEVPSRSALQLYLDRTLPTIPAGGDTTAVLVEARERNYLELDRRKRKDGAEVFIDKMPMRSAGAPFLVKLFPEQRYIFSVRHPFDVVLSCFKQNFKTNVAMEHFRTFETAVKLYDFTMQQWFSVYSLDDPRVHYVRYDTLVTDFEAVTRGVLEFLGVPWDDAVLGFAEAAEKRGARTPSYQKVRQGLSIGVQTAWRNYRFLFQSSAARPLYRWAEHFGYPME